MDAPGEMRGTLTDIVQVSTNGWAAYLASLNDGSRWYREFDISAEGPKQYLIELTELREAQRNRNRVIFRTDAPSETNPHQLDSYEILSGYAVQIR